MRQKSLQKKERDQMEHSRFEIAGKIALPEYQRAQAAAEQGRMPGAKYDQKIPFRKTLQYTWSKDER